MCCSVSPGVLVRFSQTVLYGAEVTLGDETVHVLGYQNKVQDRADARVPHDPEPLGQVPRDQSSVWSKLARFIPSVGPGNAMILPLPAVPRTMTAANVVDTKGCRDILQNMADAVVRPPRIMKSRSLAPMAIMAPPKIQVFTAAGIYTVVLAQDARDIPAAMDQVPRAKRPKLNPALFEAYAKWYPDWTVALCCFNNRQARLANPMLWWYQPMHPDRLFLPALDCHTGDVPDLAATVQVDHVLAVGSHRMNVPGLPVHYTDFVPREVQQYLRPAIIGRQYTQGMPNGDFVCRLSDVRMARFDPARSRPPAA